MTTGFDWLPDLPDVSRETLERLRRYAGLVRKWSPAINLVAKSTLDDIWSRHILDSVQVYQAGIPGNICLDLGSGGGFPGVPIAILAAEKQPGQRVALMESDVRKCAFLRTALRETGVSADVINERIESANPMSADVVTARALADLGTLLGYCQRHMAPDGIALLSKGANWEKEVVEARQEWRFDCEMIESVTRAGAAILRIRNIDRV